MDKSEKIRLAYYKTPGASLSTDRRLYEAIRNKIPQVSLAQVQKALSSSSAYNDFRQKYKNSHKEGRVIVTGPNHLFHADLAFFQPYKRVIGVLLWFSLFSLSPVRCSDMVFFFSVSTRLAKCCMLNLLNLSEATRLHGC